MGTLSSLLANGAGVATLSGVQTLTNKTLTSPTLSSPVVTNDAIVHGLTVGLGGGSVSTNTAFGSGALQAANTGGNNSAGGSQAMFYNTTGASNAAWGQGALFNNTTGSFISAWGANALLSNTTGVSLAAGGYQAGYSNTTGNNNSYFGFQAGYTNSTGVNNYYGGLQSGYNATGSYNTFVGSPAGYLVTSGAYSTILGNYNGNQGGLDIRTANGYIVLSDGYGNPRGYFDNNGYFWLKGTNSNSLLDSNGFPYTLRDLVNYDLYAGSISQIRGFVGYSGDPSYSYVLLCPSYSGSGTQNKSMFCGTVYYNRGGASTGNSFVVARIGVSAGYNTNVYGGSTVGGSTGAQIVIGTYSGVKYFFLRVASSVNSAQAVTIDAQYVSSVAPQIIADGSVSSVTVLQTL